MAETPPASPEPLQAELPEAIASPRPWALTWVWLLPAVAAIIGLGFAWQAWREHGPTITISFKTAEGIDPGKTRISYKNVDIGVVKSIALSKDASRVVVTAQMTQQVEDFLVQDTRFWVVRPRISGGSVSGLSTLFSGSHIGMDAGHSKESRRDFIGLEQPIIVTTGLPGRQYMLHATDVGSLDIGSPIYFRGIQTGQITAYDLDPNGKGVTLTIFINAPYDKFVNSNTRFWHANGVDVKLDANGLKVRSASLVSLLFGGLSFETLPDAPPTAQAAANTVYNVYADRADAVKLPDTEIDNAVMVFKESVRGLQPGAPIDFRGIIVGEVSAINIDYDPVLKEITVPVSVQLYPDRLRAKFRKNGAARPPESRELLAQLVGRGLRAQLRSANLLTGQLYIALDFFPKAAPVKFDPNKTPIEFPTTPGSLQELQATLASIAAKLDKVPFDALGKDLHQTLRSANALLQRLDNELVPEAKATIIDARKTLDSLQSSLGEDGSLQQNTQQTLREVSRAAEAFRVLSDYLERHPESLLRGKKADPP